MAPAGKLEAAPGARRIRRTITITNPEDGTQTTREIIYTDRDKVRMEVHICMRQAQQTVRTCT